MKLINPRIIHVITNPVAFTLQVLRAFQANQGLLLAGATAAVLWEIIRHALGWYFGNLSQVTVVYGSLATAIIALLSLEVAATLLLLGAQVIAEYERIEIGQPPPEAVPMRIEPL